MMGKKAEAEAEMIKFRETEALAAQKGNSPAGK
jgi:hypothetical protein